MEINAKRMNELAKETGFIRDNLEKMARLLQMLDVLFASPWKDKLVLKGGTAINLFYAGLPRLSVDIDLDYCGVGKEETVKDKAAVADFVSGALLPLGYRLSDAGKSYYALDSFVLNYVNTAGNQDNVKIEINYLDRCHVLPIHVSQADVVGIRGESPVRSLAPEELYGSKIAALLSRGKPRDLFDVYHALENGIIAATPILRKCALFYDCIGGKNLATSQGSFDFVNLTKRDFQRMLLPMLQKGVSFHHEEAISIVSSFLTQLFQFESDETEFARRFASKGYFPDLLFDDSEILKRIQNHPMALWRMRKEED